MDIYGYVFTNFTQIYVSVTGGGTGAFQLPLRAAPVRRAACQDQAEVSPCIKRGGRERRRERRREGRRALPFIDMDSIPPSFPPSLPLLRGELSLRGNRINPFFVIQPPALQQQASEVECYPTGSLLDTLGKRMITASPIPPSFPPSLLPSLPPSLPPSSCLYTPPLHRLRTRFLPSLPPSLSPAEQAAASLAAEGGDSLHMVQKLKEETYVSREDYRLKIVPDDDVDKE